MTEKKKMFLLPQKQQAQSTPNPGRPKGDKRAAPGKKTDWSSPGSQWEQV